jgi:2-polyprenyl-6-hydroxyphenyl methylase/3-demethylubiquinone-9 3-methyltransferase
MTVRNDLTLYDEPTQWWTRPAPWLRILRGLVPARLAYLARNGVRWRGSRIVDVGCGGGYFAEALAGLGARVTGVDPSSGALEAARAHAAERGLPIRYVLGRGESLPLPDASMDGAVCVDVLEHVDDPGAVVAEVARVLRPGGTFFFDTMNRTVLSSLVIVRLGEDVLRLAPRGIHDPRLFVRPSEMRAHLDRAGFRAVRTDGLGPVGFGRDPAVRFGRWPVDWIQYLGLAVRG